jgi:hypothetical protein
LLALTLLLNTSTVIVIIPSPYFGTLFGFGSLSFLHVFVTWVSAWWFVVAGAWWRGFSERSPVRLLRQFWSTLLETRIPDIQLLAFLLIWWEFRVRTTEDVSLEELVLLEQ